MNFETPRLLQFFFFVLDNTFLLVSWCVVVFDGRFANEFNNRLVDQRLPNVMHYKKEFGEFDLTNEVEELKQKVDTDE